MFFMNYTFKKTERLCSQNIITALFQKGIFSLYSFPFKFSFVPVANQLQCSQVLIVVSKRNIKNATKRNKIKRQLRELYRLNKHILTTVLLNENKQIALMIAFTGDSEMKYALLEIKFIEALNKIANAV